MYLVISGYSRPYRRNKYAQKKKKTKQGKPEVHEDLSGFDIKINEFGEIITNYQVDKLNEFLNETVEDKKLRAQKKIDSEAAQTPQKED